MHSPQDRLAEAVGLAEAIDLEIADSADRAGAVSPKPSTLFGTGKVEELEGAHREDLGAGLVIVDHAISPVQQRNLERAWNVKVLDRTGLILEIFGRRARTREGRLQVELAHLSYQKGRLVRAWTHLERQRGGRGFLGGPGEAQIELDRRMLEERIIAIRARARGRGQNARAASQGPAQACRIRSSPSSATPTPASRRSSIASAGREVYAADQVFATLDPDHARRCASGRAGASSCRIRSASFPDLPTLLVAAFRATLEEVIEADLILHVRDIAHAETEAQARDVETVLATSASIRCRSEHILEVWNKIDLLRPGGARGGAVGRSLPRGEAGADVGGYGRRGRCAARCHRRRGFRVRTTSS